MNEEGEKEGRRDFLYFHFSSTFLWPFFTCTALTKRNNEAREKWGSFILIFFRFSNLQMI